MEQKPAFYRRRKGEEERDFSLGVRDTLRAGFQGSLRRVLKLEPESQWDPGGLLVAA